MDSIRVEAKTVADAVTEASIQLGTSSDNIEYTVLSEGSRGCPPCAPAPARRRP